MLFVLPPGTVICPNTVSQTHPPLAYLALSWDSADGQTAQARIGDSGSQARWEAYMMLLAFRYWAAVVFSSHGVPCLYGDAQGMLEGATRFRSKDPVVNTMCM